MQQDKLRTLLDTNLQWLSQAEGLLSDLSDWAYSLAAPSAFGNKAGAHLRHVIEFYEAFLQGLENGHIDYDARPRDAQLERSRVTALLRIRALSEQLLEMKSILADCVLFVRVEDADTDLNQDCWLGSSVGRELQALSSHTVHHFALIAVALRAHGVVVPADFGFSPATLRYRSKAA